MDDQIKPRADTARNKPRMRPLRPGSDLAPGGQRWLCHRPEAWRCGIGHTQREAWEAAHDMPPWQRTQRAAGSAS